MECQSLVFRPDKVVVSETREAKAPVRPRLVPHLLQDSGRQCDKACFLSRHSPFLHIPGRLWSGGMGGGVGPAS